MTKEQLTSLGVDEVLAAKAAAAEAEELKSYLSKVYVSKVQFDALSEELKTAKADITARDTQIEALKKVDAGKLQEEITRLQSENAGKEQEHQTELKALKTSTAVKLALAGKVHDAGIVSSLLDISKIKVKDDGSIESGLDEQIKALEKEKAFLFVKNDKPAFRGAALADASSANSGAIGSDGNTSAHGLGPELGKALAQSRLGSVKASSAAMDYYFRHQGGNAK